MFIFIYKCFLNLLTALHCGLGDLAAIACKSNAFLEGLAVQKSSHSLFFSKEALKSNLRQYGEMKSRDGKSQIEEKSRKQKCIEL